MLDSTYIVVSILIAALELHIAILEFFKHILIIFCEGTFNPGLLSDISLSHARWNV